MRQNSFIIKGLKSYIILQEIDDFEKTISQLAEENKHVKVRIKELEEKIPINS